MNFCRVIDIGELLDIRRVPATSRLCIGDNGSFSLFMRQLWLWWLMLLLLLLWLCGSECGCDCGNCCVESYCCGCKMVKVIIQRLVPCDQSQKDFPFFHQWCVLQGREPRFVHIKFTCCKLLKHGTKSVTIRLLHALIHFFQSRPFFVFRSIWN